MANRLPDGNTLGLLFGRCLWKRDRQDAVLHLGLYILWLTRCVSIHCRRINQPKQQAYLGSKGNLQRPGEFPRATFTNNVVSLFLRVQNGRLARNRQTVLVDVDGDAFRCQTGEFKCCRHGIGILGFVKVQSREDSLRSECTGKDGLPWTVGITMLQCRVPDSVEGAQARGEPSCESVFKETLKLGGGVLVEINRHS
jgi:hypothetical protein